MSVLILELVVMILFESGLNLCIDIVVIWGCDSSFMQFYACTNLHKQSIINITNQIKSIKN